jgi:hypothetical protein
MNAYEWIDHHLSQNRKIVISLGHDKRYCVVIWGEKQKVIKQDVCLNLADALAIYKDVKCEHCGSHVGEPA